VSIHLNIQAPISFRTELIRATHTRKQLSRRIGASAASSVLLLCGLGGLGLQAFAQTPPANAPTTQAGGPPATPAPGKGTSAASSGGAPVDSNTYIIGPTDVLFVRVWNEAEFSGPVAVHQDGKFTLPLVGDLDAGGKTPVEVQDVIAKALTKYVVKPLVTVTVQEVGSKRYYMDGQVPHPGEFPLVVPTTVFEALSKAGGIGEFANSKKIYVLRGDKRIPFNYKEVLKGKNMAQNIQLKPNDHIVVP
jgi:polysaccharide export outer membrane protein